MTVARFILFWNFLTGNQEADEIHEKTRNRNILNSKMPSSCISFFHDFLLNYSNVAGCYDGCTSKISHPSPAAAASRALSEVEGVVEGSAPGR
jgi:hypothetical protein